MALISRQSIEEVRARADIVAFINDYTQLKKVGSSWKGLSPFVSEKTPSFYVQPGKGFFYCFSTSKGGDVFKFLILKEGLNFQESVERVAARFGIKLQYEQGGPGGVEQSLRAQLLAIHDTAAMHFATAFRAQDTHAQEVRAYWERQRRFTLETASLFQIGFAPVDGGRLASTLLKAGYTKDALAKSGLFVGMDYAPDPLRWRARFRGRLIIPIRDVQGRVIAFTARQLPCTPQNDPSHEAKYINSPETEIFHKSHVLFNLDKARNGTRDGTPIVLVEGQLDAIRAYTCGVTTVVASQGTAIGTEHMALIRRYTQCVDALLDSDRAGQAAVAKLLPVALASGIEVRVLRIPNGKDPDEYFANAGSDGWPAVRNNPSSAIAFAVNGLLDPAKTYSSVQKLEALQTLFAMVAQAESAVVRDEALREISRLTALDSIAVSRDFQRYLRKPARPAPNTETPTETTPDATPLNPVEEVLLAILLRDTRLELARPLAEIIMSEWLNTETPAGRLLDSALAEILHGEWIGLETMRSLIETDDDDTGTLLARISTQEELAHTDTQKNTFAADESPQGDKLKAQEDNLRKQANECLSALFRRFIKRRRTELATSIASLPTDDFSRLRELQTEEIALRNSLKHIPTLPAPTPTKP
ncbi:MAG: DNA primase [Puniceicoccales bacterium]|jgi:DNA primase|nr:DNA primase [Puniceicoccales bacterium]